MELTKDIIRVVDAFEDYKVINRDADLTVGYWAEDMYARDLIEPSTQQRATRLEAYRQGLRFLALINQNQT